VFYGFVFYLLVNVLDVLKGFVPPAWYAAVDLRRRRRPLPLRRRRAVGVLILVGVAFFLVRRFVTGDRRLEQREGTLQHEAGAGGGIRRDSLIVGLFILGHVGFRLLGEGFYVAYEGHPDPWQPFATAIAGAIGYGPDRLIGWHVGWWGALGLILAFLPYFPRSKHIHLLLAPVNFALERRFEDGERVPTGALEPIDVEDETLEQFGASTLEHLRVPQLLDAYACIQCNRCSNVCPANATGKALSPAALEINKRYELTLNAAAWRRRAEPAAAARVRHQPRGDVGLHHLRRLHGGLPGRLRADDRHRRHPPRPGDDAGRVPEPSCRPPSAAWSATGNPWGLSRDERMAWTEGLDVTVPTVDENPDFEVLFWVGCAGSYDPAAQATTRAMARLLERAGVNYAVLGKGETCTGDPARRAGNEYLYYQLASENVMVLNEALASHAVDAETRKLVVTTCPHCFNALIQRLPAARRRVRGGAPHAVPRRSWRGAAGAGPRRRQRHLPRPLLPGAAQRRVRRAAALWPRSPATCGRCRAAAPRSFCCGAGGAQFWKEEEAGDAKVADVRVRRGGRNGRELVAVGCPFCKVMLASAEGAPAVKDVAQLLDEASASSLEALTPEALFQLHPQPLLLVDSSVGRLLEVNDAALLLYGYGRDAFLGMHLTDLWADDEALPDLDALAREDGGEVVRHRTATVDRLPVQLAMRSLPDEPPRWLVTVQDVSRQVEAEESARRSERLYRAIVENAFDGVALLGPDLTNRTVGSRAAAALGFRTLELAGRDRRDLIHPADRKLFQDALGKLRGRPGEREGITYRMRDAHGRWHWLEGTVTNMVDDPDIGAFVLNYHDITDRVRATEAAKDLNAQLERRMQHLQALRRIDMAITNAVDVGLALDIFLEQVQADLLHRRGRRAAVRRAR
jgi:PAS domain S-box-containing protein